MQNRELNPFEQLIEMDKSEKEIIQKYHDSLKRIKLMNQITKILKRNLSQEDASKMEYFIILFEEKCDQFYNGYRFTNESFNELIKKFCLRQNEIDHSGFYNFFTNDIIRNFTKAFGADTVKNGLDNARELFKSNLEIKNETPELSSHNDSTSDIETPLPDDNILSDNQDSDILNSASSIEDLDNNYSKLAKVTKRLRDIWAKYEFFGEEKNLHKLLSEFGKLLNSAENDFTNLKTEDILKSISSFIQAEKNPNLINVGNKLLLIFSEENKEELSRESVKIPAIVNHEYSNERQLKLKKIIDEGLRNLCIICGEDLSKTSSQSASLINQEIKDLFNNMEIELFNLENTDEAENKFAESFKLEIKKIIAHTDVGEFFDEENRRNNNQPKGEGYIRTFLEITAIGLGATPSENSLENIQLLEKKSNIEKIEALNSIYHTILKPSQNEHITFIQQENLLKFITSENRSIQSYINKHNGSQPNRYQKHQMALIENLEFLLIRRNGNEKIPAHKLDECISFQLNKALNDPLLDANAKKSFSKWASEQKKYLSNIAERDTNSNLLSEVNGINHEQISSEDIDNLLIFMTHIHKIRGGHDSHAEMETNKKISNMISDLKALSMKAKEDKSETISINEIRKCIGKIDLTNPKSEKITILKLINDQIDNQKIDLAFLIDKRLDSLNKNKNLDKSQKSLIKQIRLIHKETGKNSNRFIMEILRSRFEHDNHNLNIHLQKKDKFIKHINNDASSTLLNLAADILSLADSEPKRTIDRKLALQAFAKVLLDHFNEKNGKVSFAEIREKILIFNNFELIDKHSTILGIKTGNTDTETRTRANFNMIIGNYANLRPDFDQRNEVDHESENDSLTFKARMDHEIHDHPSTELSISQSFESKNDENILKIKNESPLTSLKIDNSSSLFQTPDNKSAKSNLLPALNYLKTLSDKLRLEVYENGSDSIKATLNSIDINTDLNSIKNEDQLCKYFYGLFDKLLNTPDLCEKDLAILKFYQRKISGTFSTSPDTPDNSSSFSRDLN